MTVFLLATPVAHLLSTIRLDDTGVSLVALLAGMVGGYRLTGWHEQLKARRARVRREPPRKPGE